MAEHMSVRCPECRREHAYAPAYYPCPCGAPVNLALVPGGAAVPVHHRTWSESWVSVRCTDCGRLESWPQPELGCPCGALLRLPIDGEEGCGDEECGEQSTAPTASRPPEALDRPAFRPVTIRTARDAVLAAGHYLRWLGFTEVKAAQNRPASGIDLRGREVVARVDPTTRPTTVRAVETLWLNGLNESVTAVCFSLAGYDRSARDRADALGLALFVLDLTGTPQPVNDAADRLVREGTRR